MVYIMSDIHGNKRRFDSILQQINLTHNDTLYILGDIIDRHPSGVEILEFIMEQPNIQMLLGNHEHMMLSAIDPKYRGYNAAHSYDEWGTLRLWYRNGGTITHEALKRLDNARKEKICEYLRDRPLYFDIEVNGMKYKLVHAYPIEFYGEYHYEYSDPRTFAVWHRYHKEELVPEDYILIFGHTPTEMYQPNNPLRIYHGNRVIGMDCGSGYEDDSIVHGGKQGNLACLCLDNGAEYYSEEKLCNE
ncbi:MAG: fructose-bisphosphatase class III [Clostridia bacterium]|nr:fructose-bisphosphatase class III [Clostridia bacterium]